MMTRGSVKKLANIDQVANGVRKNSALEINAIVAKNKVQAMVTRRA